MKKILFIFLGLALVAIGVYYFSIYKGGNFSGSLSVSDFVSKMKFSEDSEIAKQGEEVGGIAKGLINKTGDLFAQLSATFSSTADKVSDTVSVVDEQIKNNKMAKVVSILSGSGDTNSSSGSITNQEVRVCINFSLDQKINFLIKNPFLDTSSTYSIDWGDGHTDKNIFATTTIEVFHSYINSGEFITKFKVESGESVAEVSKVICIK